MCFEICTVQFAWPAYHQCDSTTSEGNPDLNYQSFTGFIICLLAVPQSSKCIQISEVQLQIIKKCFWLHLLIQNEYRSMFSHHKAVIPISLQLCGWVHGLPQLCHRDLQAGESFLVSVRNQGKVMLWVLQDWLCCRKEQPNSLGPGLLLHGWCTVWAHGEQPGGFGQGIILSYVIEPMTL